MNDTLTLTELRELSKKRVRRTIVGPWGYESIDDELTIAEFLVEVEEAIKRKNQPVMRPFPKYGELMSIREFKQCVDCGAFIPDDGDGFWATDALESNVSVWNNKRPAWATHVRWYNK